MSIHSQSDSEVAERLWKEIDKVRYGMLGLVGRRPTQHFQPMTAFCEPDKGLVWFFTRNDTDLARAATGEGGQAMFIVQAKDQTFQACIGGRLTQNADRTRMNRFWNPVVAAWYPDGKDDPRLTLLCLQVADAQNCQAVFKPFRAFVSAMREQTVIAGPDPHRTK